MSTTLYWHDYETSGADPRRDRPMQFAGVRTDESLNIISEPMTVYCQLANDVLPQPDACMITGITPQYANQHGLVEAEFIQTVLNELGQAGTCGVGYNSLRFDDEITRMSLYRNFHDPYAREWQNGNSRWDIIDMMRLTHALRPEGIEWPKREDGFPSFRLEELSKANNILHESAHDALSDVYATIAMAKLVKDKQPRLYDYVFKHRLKREVQPMLSFQFAKPLIHVSAMYGPDHLYTAMILPVAQHPTNSNGVIVYDLRYDPQTLMDLSTEEIQRLIFTPRRELPEDSPKIPLKTVHVNKCPVLVPLSTLNEASSERVQIDIEQSMRHAEFIHENNAFSDKVAEVFNQQQEKILNDPDFAIYDGFFQNEDKPRMQQVRDSKMQDLAELKPVFRDKRLPELFFRYRARNYPESLNEEERIRWNEFRLERLTDENSGASIVLEGYLERIAEIREEENISEAKLSILNELEDYADQLTS